MTNKESLHEMLNFGKPEVLCQYEWGYWAETVSRWKTEGMAPDCEPWEATGITHYHRLPVESRIYPPFEEKILSKNKEKQIVQDSDGIIKEVYIDKTAFPRFIKHTVENIGDFEKLKERLDPHSPGRIPENWSEKKAIAVDEDAILVMGRVEISFFGWLRDLMGVENLLLAYYDQPELIHAINRQHVYFLKEFYSKIMMEVEFDYIFMWEDMCFKNGPLISPSLFREFVLPYYREIIDFFKSICTYKVLVDSDGDVSQLIPLFIEGGVDGILPFEVAAGMDIRQIRKEYPELIIAGGIDKREIAKGRDAIDQELEGKLPFMFKNGGYCPSMDHHVHPEVSYENFQYYLEKTREIYKRSR